MNNLKLQSLIKYIPEAVIDQYTDNFVFLTTRVLLKKVVDTILGRTSEHSL